MMSTSVQAGPEVSFVAAFEGPAVETGRMNAKDFAPSLFATAALIESAAEVIHHRKNPVTVQIQADFRRGSFDYALVAAAVIGQQLFTNLSVSDLESLLRLLGFKVGEQNSLFAVLRRIRGRNIENVQPAPDGRAAITVTGDNTTIIVNPHITTLLMNQSVREAVPDIVAPVSKPGITAYRVGELGATKPSLLVTKDDLPALSGPPPFKSELADGTAVTALELLAPNFVEGNKWRVAQGGEPFWVRILDQVFLESVEQGDRGFHKGDFLVVELRTKVHATAEGLEAERDVIRVIDHKHRGRQLGLI